MARKVNKDYVNQYRKIILTQPLAHGKYIQQVYTKEGLTWKVTHTTNSAYHICPYDGIFRNCKDCGALEDDFDIKFCLKKEQILSPIRAIIIKNIHFRLVTKGEALFFGFARFVVVDTESLFSMNTVSLTTFIFSLFSFTAARSLARVRSVICTTFKVSPASFC